MRQFSYATKLILRLSVLAIVLSLVATGCAGRKSQVVGSSDYGPTPQDQSATQQQASPQVEMGPEEPVGPLPSPDFTPPQDGYVLVLGPGLARTLAYIGVLHELERRAVPIRAVVSVEMGAVIGGIWVGSNANNLEWEMHKFKRQTLLDVPLLSIGDRQAEGKRLYSFLGKALKMELLQKAKIPFVVVSGVTTKNENDASTLIESSGSAKDIIRGAMGIPGVITPYVWEGQERITAAIESPFPVKEAKDLGLGQTICVDVLGKASGTANKNQVENQLATFMRSVATVARQQLKQCDTVLSVPTDGVGYFDFDAKADLIYRGKLATQKWLERVK